MNKKFLILAIVLMVAAGGMFVFQNQTRSFRIAPDWSYDARFLGDLAYPDEQGNLPTSRDINVWERTMKVVEWTPDRAVISDEYTTLDINTGEVTWQVKSKFQVDPKTGKHLDSEAYPEAKGMYYTLPRNVEKKDYQMFNYFQEPFTISFDRTEIIDGMDLYVYKYEGDLESTGIYKGSEDFPAIEVPEGQRIVSHKLVFEYWVEPNTGEFVKIHEESGGDYYSDIASGERLGLVFLWAGTSTSDAVSDSIDDIRNYLLWCNIQMVWVPGGLFVLGLVCLIFSVRSGRSNQNSVVNYEI